jgi:hypothetical protein
MAKKILKKAKFGKGVTSDPNSVAAPQRANPTTSNTPPTGNNPLRTGVYRGPKPSAAEIKKSQEDWNKKEKEKTNPKNKPAGSALTPLKRGGMIKKKK